MNLNDKIKAKMAAKLGREQLAIPTTEVPPKPERPQLEVFRKSDPPQAKNETNPAQPPLKKGTPPIVRYETIKASCGHGISFGLFEDKKDKFRDARRKKHENKPCKACREVANSKLQEEAKERKKTRQAHRRELSDKPRLPNESTYHVVYDAEKVQWSGTLEIKGCPIFTSFAGGVFKLLQRLDDLYRLHLRTVTHDEKKTPE